MVKSPIQILQSYGISTSSFVTGVRQIIQQMDDQQLQTADIKTRIEELLDQPIDITDPLTIQHAYLYFIQNLIKHNIAAVVPNVEECFLASLKQAVGFVEQNPWHWSKSSENSDGSDLPQKSKQDLALDIYNLNKTKPRAEVLEIFKTQLGMSQAGAQTYYYNMKKKSEAK